MVIFVFLFLFLFLLADFSICLETECEVGWLSKWAGLEKRHCSKEKNVPKKDIFTQSGKSERACININ